MNEPSTAALARSAVEDLGRLVHEELTLAKEELRSDLGRARHAALPAALGLVLSALGLSTLVVGFAVERPRPATRLGASLFVVGVGLTLLASRKLPTTIFGRTKAQLRADMRAAQEAIT